ncbi:lamin tail domain-containing protein [Haladaptatus salinisoli]|uniref:lamin tail domain-containing protein n=1 Tax=Haladaptatus salinisoli TaxID=2884876 RepID=UPI001D09B539|nr:lamin tail domain-containing protein [Haladaptatus salinisoli]
MNNTRRNVLVGLGAVATVGFGATQVFGQADTNIEVKEVNYEGEYVVFANNGSEDVDVSGYTVAFEYENDGTDQRKALGENVTIPAGGTLTVATGAEDVPNADETLDYKRSVLRNDGSDVVALLTPEGEEVATSEDAPVTKTTTPEETTTTEEESDKDCPNIEIEAVGTTDPDEETFATFRVTNHEDKALKLGYSNVVTTVGQGTVTVDANSETTFEVLVNTYGRVELRMWAVDGPSNCFPIVKNEIVDDDGEPGKPSPTTSEGDNSSSDSDSSGDNTTTTPNDGGKSSGSSDEDGSSSGEKSGTGDKEDC